MAQTCRYFHISRPTFYKGKASSLSIRKGIKPFLRYSCPSPGYCLQVDIKYVPKHLAPHQLYQYSAIDDCSRWRFSIFTEERSHYHSLLFLHELLKAVPSPYKPFETDNDSAFTNLYTGYPKTHPLKAPRPHPFTAFCESHSIRHRLIKVASPRLNGKVERAHRSDEEKFYRPALSFSTISELQEKLQNYLQFYNNHRPHCSLDYLSPNQFLKSFSIAGGVNNH